VNGNFLKQLFNRRTSSFIIFLVALITIVSLIPLSGLHVDFNPAQLLKKNDPDKATYDQFKTQFNASSEEQNIFIALKNRRGIFQKDFLVKADSLTRFLLRHPKVLRVYSLTSTTLIYFNGEDVNARPLLHVNQPEFYKEDSIYLFESNEYRDLLVSARGDCIAIGAFNDTSLTHQEKEQLLQSIEAKIKELNFDESHLISRIQFEKASMQKGKRLLSLCFFGLLIVIVIGYLLLHRSVKEIMINLAVILTTLLWSLALISLFGSSLNFLTLLLQVFLLLVVSISLIFIGNIYRRNTTITTGWTAGRRIISSAIIILLTAISVYFISQKKIDSHLANAVSRSMASDLKYMDQNFYGSRPFEMVLRIKNNQPGFYDTAMMHKVEDIQNYLRDSLRVGALISPNSLFKGANKAFHGGSSNYFRIPDSAHHIQRFAEAIMQTEYADELQRYMVADGSSIRISGRLEDVGTEQFHILSEKLQKFYARNYSQHFSYQITGTAVIYDKISVFLVKILAIAFILAIGIYILFVLIFGQTGRNKNHF